MAYCHTANYQMAWHGIEWYDMVWYGIFLVDILKKMQLEKKHIHVHN